MKIVGTESLKVGDIFVVREVNDTLFSKKIKIERLRSEEEINGMLRYAHANMKKSFWRGVKHALFWVTKVIEKKEVSVENEDSEESQD
ncbi:MAG: hypothetical protein J7J91_10045 [Deltaproteobacteria bacterium]|nr:hypothetical protein [Methanomicrobia archaeon]MCD6138883.1 hypothetical protein [Deltaproteobacteria bacterium]